MSNSILLKSDSNYYQLFVTRRSTKFFKSKIAKTKALEINIDNQETKIIVNDKTINDNTNKNINNNNNDTNNDDAKLFFCNQLTLVNNNQLYLIVTNNTRHFFLIYQITKIETNQQLQKYFNAKHYQHNFFIFVNQFLYSIY